VPLVLPAAGAAGGDSGRVEIVVVATLPAEIYRETKNVALRMTSRREMSVIEQ
jgi:hypothetical protein